MSLKGLIEVNPRVKVGANEVIKNIIRLQDPSQNVVMKEAMIRIERELIIKEVDLEIVVVETMEEIETEIDTEKEIEEMIGEMIEEMTEEETMEETEIESVKEIEEMMEEQTAGGKEEEMIEKRILRLTERRKPRNLQDKALLSEELCLLNGMMMKISRNSKQMEITLLRVFLQTHNKDNHLNNELLDSSFIEVNA